MTRDTPADVLIVDDRSEQRLALSTLLGEIADHVVEAASGREALRWLLRRDFAVILLDVNMPDMDGFETASLIRKRKTSEHTPIIFVTAYGDDTHASRGYSLGAVDYILTPIDSQILQTKVSVFVDLFRKSEQLKRQAESLLEHTSRLRRLTEASSRIHAVRAVDDLLRVVADSALSLVGARQVAVSLVVPARSSLSWTPGTPPGRRSVRHPQETALELLESRALAAARAAPTWRSREQLDADPEWSRLGVDEGCLPLRGWLAAPLGAGEGAPAGWIQLSDKESGDFDAQDESLLVQLGQMAAGAAENILSADAREANRIKDEFLATLSHELRTPLQAILTWASALRENPVEAGTLARGLEVIERNARAQTRLIEDLLDVSRIITGKLVLDKQLVCLGDLARTVAEDARPTAERKQVELRIEGQPVDAFVSGDPNRLRQVIGNLLANALKFTPAGGRVEVGVLAQGSAAELRVQDTGAGIAPDFLPHLFERFRQGDGGTTRAHGGLGIGLAIVRHLVDLHGGSVRAESQGEGRGATFVVTLPLTEAGGARQPKTFAPMTPSRVQPRLDGLHVLVVDDERETRECLQVALEHYGAAVAGAGSVAEALAVLDRERIDVLVSDLAMPGEDGYSLIRKVRARGAERSANVPAAALSAHVRAEEKAHAVLAGFDLHLSKPIDPVALAATVQGLAARTRP
jgi:signal transduction histidine kinase/DNA-binding response OmpR family regulator